MPKLDGLKTDELRRATFLLTDEIYDAFRLKCLLEGKQVNDLARRILCEHIEEKYFKQLKESRAAVEKEKGKDQDHQLLGKKKKQDDIEEL